MADGLESLGLSDNAGGRRRMVESLDRRAIEEGLERAGIPLGAPEVDRPRSHLRRGWYWGSQQFAQRVLELADAALRKQRHPSGRTGGESKAHGEAEAGRLLREGLRAAGLKLPDLPRLKGSDARKVAIARVIWQNTSVQMGWIAEKLVDEERVQRQPATTPVGDSVSNPNPAESSGTLGDTVMILSLTPNDS